MMYSFTYMICFHVYVCIYIYICIYVCVFVCVELLVLVGYARACAQMRARVFVANVLRHVLVCRGPCVDESAGCSP